MKLSELIEKAQEALDENGDGDVVTHDEDWDCTYEVTIAEMSKLRRTKEDVFEIL
jgi:hypothetical protein